MNKKKYSINMTQGPLLKNIIIFAIPLVLSNLLQLFYNTADLVVVSRFAGSQAMGSVGATGSVTSLILNIGIGLSVGAGVVVSKYFGAGDKSAISRAVHTSVFISFILGLFFSVLGFSLTRPLLMLTGVPEGNVLDGAVLYMRIIFLGVPASMVYNFCASILRAVGDTKRPLYILGLTGLMNVALNLVFVIVFHMDVAGVAIATIAANYASAIMALRILMRTEESYKLVVNKLRIYKAELVQIIRIGLPAGIQSSFFNLANTVIQSTVNSFGAAAISGNVAAANIENFIYIAMNSFAQAAVTGVSQNYGAGNVKRIYKTIGLAICCVSVIGTVMGVLCVIFANPLLSIYITDSAEAVEFAKIRMITTLVPYFLAGIMDTLTGSLRGLGRSSISAVNSFVGACGFRILWIIVVLPFNRTPRMLFWCWPLSWMVVIAMHLITHLVIRKSVIREVKMSS